jgi:phage shock protein PspC (stress-responsive transcriptional regulator)
MTTATTPAPLTRARDGRVLGGVCAGLARRYDLHPGWLRLAFVLGALAGGAGVLVYLAGWLIVPGEGESGAGGRAIVALAQASAAAIGLVTLAAVGAAGTLFGFGWVILAVAAVILAGVLMAWGRVGPAWALLPLGALLIPSVALAATGLRVHPMTGAQSFEPRAVGQVDGAEYVSGLGPLFVDLRRTAFPAAGTVSVHVDAGLRRTIVALPHDRCVHVQVAYDVPPVAAQLADVLAGRSGEPAVTAFGAASGSGSGRLGSTGRRRGPTLRIAFRSAGGSLYVRDYPDAVDPQSAVDWPGYDVVAEPRPVTTGLKRHAKQRLLAHWRARHDAQVESARRHDLLEPGPCAAQR